jgi:hypothetical protein
MKTISYSRAVALVLIAGLTTALTVFADGLRTSDISSLQEFGPLVAVYGTKALSAGISAGITSLIAYLTVPFKELNANSLKQE